MKKIILALGSILCASVANASVIYDSIVSPLPYASVSEGYECCQYSNLGNAVTFDGTDRQLGDVTVVMTNWAYESEWTNLIGSSPDYTAAGFYLPLTLNLYAENGGSEGALIGSQTLNAFIPWRPAPDPVNCPAGQNNVNNQWQAPDGQCYNGANSTVTFDFAGLTVPDNLIYTLAYNTQNYGANPTGTSGPYNSLNFGLTTTGPTVGSDTYPGTLIGNDQPEGAWAPYTPQVQFNASSATPEPATWVLMFGSLAAVALVARRRVKA